MALIQLDANSTTLVLNGTVIADLVEGDFLEINAVNPLTSQVNSSDGGVTLKNALTVGYMT
jgi:hypothetical protein